MLLAVMEEMALGAGYVLAGIVLIVVIVFLVITILGWIVDLFDSYSG